jgi:type VII secretion protein EccB
LVTVNLGLDPAVTYPIEISNALFDAMPATEPLVVPAIPEAGTPSRWLPGSTVGSVLETQDANGAVTGFYALLPDGVQKITSFVADLLRTALAQGSATPTLVSPDKLIHIPVVEVLDVGYYPSGKLSFIDTTANPVICVAWQKQSTDPQATITVLSGRDLPVPIGMDPRLVRLVRDDRQPDSVEADQALVLPGGANFVATTSGVATSNSRESLYWLSPQGVRYGVQWDRRTLEPLGLDAGSAVQAPWPIVRTFAAGPAIRRDSALLARDTVTGGGAVAPVPEPNQSAGG